MSDPEMAESGPPPGGFLAAADRFSQSIAGGYGVGEPSGDAAADAAAQRRSLLRLLATIAMMTAVAIAVQTSTSVPLFTIEAIVAVLIVIIMLHEFGHLWVAKRCGIKVTEYFVGFGPTLWSFRRGETEYGLKPVLAGGYVRIIGMNNLESVPDADEPRTYRQRPWNQRAAVSLAGPMVHFVIAFLILFVLFGVIGQQTAQSQVAGVDSLANGDRSPAQIAGFQVGDRIVSIDGRSAKDWQKVVPYIQSHAGVPLTVVVNRGGHLLTLVPTPADITKIVFKDSKGQPIPQAAGAEPVGLIGLEPTRVTVRTDPLTAVSRSASGLVRGVGLTVVGFGRLFSPKGLTTLGHQVVAGKTATADATAVPAATEQRASGVVGIGRQATQAVGSGLGSVLVLLFGLNLSLGVLNLIPLLPFDGGHIAIAVYERIRSRAGHAYRADITKMLPATYALLMVVAFIFLSTLYLDVAHPVANPFR